MKLSSFHKKHLFLLLIMNFFLLGCSTEDDPVDTNGTDDNPVPVSGIEVKTLEIVTIEVNSDVSAEEYAGIISGKDVPVVKLDKNHVMFMVPADMEEGIAELSIPNLELEITYDISRASLNHEPEEVFNTLYQKATTEMAAFNDSSEALYVAEYWAQLKESFDDATEAEKEAAALYYSVNQDLFNGVLTSDDDRMQDSNYTTLLKHKAYTLAFGTGVAVAILGPTPIEKALGAGLAIIAWKKSKGHLQLLMEQKLKKVNFIVDDLVSDITRSQSNLNFTHNKARTLSFNVQQREINSSDSDSSNENMGLFFSGYNLFNETVAKLNELINFINENLFFSDIEEVTGQSLGNSNPVSTNVNEEIYENLSWSIAGDEIEITEVTFEEELTFKLSIKDAENLEEEYVDTFLQYTYNDSFNDFTGSFPVRVKKPVIKVVTLSGASLPSPLELINNTPTELKLVDENGSEIEDFDISNLAVTNISNSEVSLHAQQNGAFGGGSGGEYFEIIPLTDDEEAEFSFDLVYNGVRLDSYDAVVKQRGNGFMMKGEFYELSKGFLQRYESEFFYSHEVVIASSNITSSGVGFSGTGSNQAVAFELISSYSNRIPDGTYSYSEEEEEKRNSTFRLPGVGFNLSGSSLQDDSWERINYNIKGGVIEVENDGEMIFIKFEFVMEDNSSISGAYKGTFEITEFD